MHAAERITPIAQMNGFDLSRVREPATDSQFLGQSGVDEILRIVLENADAAVAIIGAIFGGYQAVQESRRVSAAIQFGDTRIETSGPAPEVKALIRMLLENLKGQVTEVRLDDGMRTG